MNPTAYQNDRVSCFSPVTVVDTIVDWRMIWNIVNDISITVLEFLLLIWNRYKAKKYRTYVLILYALIFNMLFSQLACSTLEDKFNLREIKISISVIYPYSLVHSIGYCFQIYSYLWFTSEVRHIDLHEGVYRYGLVNLVRSV
jgi:hypothetical protein